MDRDMRVNSKTLGQYPLRGHALVQPGVWLARNQVFTVPHRTASRVPHRWLQCDFWRQSAGVDLAQGRTRC